MKTTMADVAREAQVSISTVSHVLNGTRRVKQSTREAVIDAIQKLNYEAPRTIRSLRAGARPSLGIVGSILENSGGLAQLLEVMRAAEDEGFEPIMADSLASIPGEERAVRTLLAQHVDSIAISPVRGWRRHSLRLLRQSGIPFVVVGVVDRGTLAHQIAPDRAGAIQIITQTLLRSGTGHPVLVFPDRHIAAGSEQMRGFERAHALEGKRVGRGQLLAGTPSETRLTRNLMRALSDGGDGLVLGSSAFARSALAAAAHLGLIVGYDVKVAVFDDAPKFLPTPEQFVRAIPATDRIADRAIALLRSQIGQRPSTQRKTETVLPVFIAGKQSGISARALESHTKLSETYLTNDYDDVVLTTSAHGRRAAGWNPTDRKHTIPPRVSKEIPMTNSQFPDRYFPGLHIRPRFGWVNDPNGFHRVGDTWHMFYQHNPEAPWHNQITWGHMTSKDLVNWVEQPIALRPRSGKEDSAGCWSGIGLTHEGISSLLYTGVTRQDGPYVTILAEQLADGSRWERTAVVAEMPPIENVRAMRDPFVFEHDGKTLAIHGGGFDDGTPAVFVYDASDWKNWKFLGTLLKGDDAIASVHAHASIWECPQLVPVGNKWVLILSLWVEAETLMDHLTGVAYLVGDLDLSAGYPQFIPSDGGSFDRGADFYAPQCKLDDDRVLAWGWTWEGAERSDQEIDESGYNGALTFPREVVMTDGRVHMRPAPEIYKLRERGLRELTHIDIPFSADLTGEGTVQLSDTQTGEDLVRLTINGEASLWVDGSIVEFFGAGPSVTQRVYPKGSLKLTTSENVNVQAFALSAFDDDGARRANAVRFANEAE